MGKKLKHHNDYREREVVRSMGLLPLSGNLTPQYYIEDENKGETIDPETIEALIDRETTEDLIFKRQLEHDISDMLDSLTPRESKILKLRFGIGANKDYTLEEVAKLFDVTRERIRQIEAKALRKMRHPSRADILKNYLYGDYGDYVSYLDVKERFWQSECKMPHPDEVEWWTHRDWVAYWNRKKVVEENLAKVKVEKQAELERLRQKLKSGVTNFREED